MERAPNNNHSKNTMEKIAKKWKLRTAGSAISFLLVSALATGCAVAPKPLTQAELSLAATESLARVDADQETISAPIDLYEAMARALKYNLDHRVEMMRIALSQRQLDRAGVNMLPNLVASSGYAGRDSVSASYSQSLLSGIRSRDPSFSTEKQNFTGDLTFTWHVLDFGLSYVRAQQAADKALIAGENKRKVANKIIEDVRTAYWRAISAERLLKGFQTLEGRVAKAQKNTRHIALAGETSPLAALTFERELVDIKRQIQRLERELSHAKLQLAALMNVRPGTSFSLVVPDRALTELNIRMSGDDMVKKALENRPEFRDLLYQGRINVKEADAAILEVLPSPAAYAGLNLDSNDFLYNTNWVTFGAKASWNLVKLLQYPARSAEVKAQRELLEQQTLATVMAVMTQVHVARARYGHLRKLAATQAEYYEIQRRIERQVSAQIEADAASEQTVIREKMNTLVAAVEFDIAYADLQNAYAGIYVSLGIDPIDERISTDMSVSEMATELKAIWRQRGDLDG
jgi:outer membrane protein TolC